MKVLIDTNILISAAYSRLGVPNQAYQKAVEPPYQAFVCEQNIEDLLIDDFTFDSIILL